MGDACHGLFEQRAGTPEIQPHKANALTAKGGAVVKPHFGLLREKGRQVFRGETEIPAVQPGQISPFRDLYFDVGGLVVEGFRQVISIALQIGSS